MEAEQRVLAAYDSKDERRAPIPRKHLAWDEARIVTVPRYKRSHASGDEWRHSLSVCYYWKGELLYRHDGWWPEEPRTLAQIFDAEARHTQKPEEMQGRGELCDQEGCTAQASTIYRMKRVFVPRVSDSGLVCHYAVEVDPYADDKRPLVRKFCAAHSTRGDCSRHDADENYVVVSGLGPQAVDQAAVSRSAAYFVYADNDGTTRSFF